MNNEKIIKNIRENLQNYLITNGIKSLVIGVSGGIDSALSCALAEPVCKELKIPLIGISIPIETNKPDEISRAKDTGEVFCDKFMELDLTHLYQTEKTFLWNKIARQVIENDLSNTQEKVANGNLKARDRMRLLYFVAGITGGMVLTNDNKTELMLGFWTLHGDVGDYGMIQNLWKTEIYELAKYFCINFCHHQNPEIWNKAKVLESCIEAIPTDGLGITNSDLDQLGAPTYAEVDHILQIWIEPGNPAEALALKDHPVVQRHIKSQFKRNNPYNISREDLFKDTI